jgi:hypothetical protein
MSESIDEIIDRKVRECVDAALDERLAALRPLLLRDAGSETPGEFGDALDVARLMGYDVSSERAKKSSVGRIYYLARTGSIPIIRLGKKRVRFDLDKIRRMLASGGVGVSHSSGGATQNVLSDE